MKTVYKPWGKEEWLELNDRYCYKRIYINAGYRTSYQYHNFKRETNYIISGEAEVWLENDEGVVEKKIMKAGEYFNVTPPKKHRVIALTDIILQEVSTPEVDDVIRIQDDSNRADGKIQGEHETPGVLILSAGKGTRLKELTLEINKALLPIDNQAVISRVISKYPSNFKFVIAVGYKSQSLKDYIKTVYPTHDITFVDIDDIESQNSGPGHSALNCKEYLQRPFYLQTVDCLLSSELPKLDNNWLGVHTTSYPEKYSTVKVEGENIVGMVNKGDTGYDLAFIGLAGILDYEVFWNELQNNTVKGEIVPAFFNPSRYSNFKYKKLDWFDTGNIDDLEKARLYFNDKPLSLSKSTGEITYKDNGKFLKFIPSLEKAQKLFNRGKFLHNFIPSNLNLAGNFISYDWTEGDTLYSLDNFGVYMRFMEDYFSNINLKSASTSDLKQFYVDKTRSRIDMFLEKYGDYYQLTPFTINSNNCQPLNSILEQLDFTEVLNTQYTDNFHGDLQFDNIVYSDGRFKFIDWRDSFGFSEQGGDVYYDLAKLYGGIRIPYNLMKNEDNIKISVIDSEVIYSYSTLKTLPSLEQEFEFLVNKHGFDFDRVKLITGIIFLNMSPLHDYKFGNLVWFEGIRMLNEYVNQ
jgi:choline kinase/mannose-6-phosphate isomerase-like protein (cupin superfamily)/thiamine kinase-like enzyme